MLRNFTSIVLGISIGMIIMMLMHYLSMLFYPLPEGVSMSDAEKFKENPDLYAELFGSDFGKD